MLPMSNRSPTVYRWRIGPLAVAEGVVSDQQSGNPISVIVEENDVVFTSFVLTVGAPVNPDDTVPPYTSAANPSTVNMIVDVEVSSDQGVTWTSVWSGIQANMPQLAAGRISQVTGDWPSRFTVHVGQYLRANVIQGNGQNILLECFGTISP
jgi:hypothetical protein